MLKRVQPSTMYYARQLAVVAKLTNSTYLKMVLWSAVAPDCDYGQYVEPEQYRYNYPDLVDIVFDHEPELISCGHFTSGVEPLHTFEGLSLCVSM